MAEVFDGIAESASAALLKEFFKAKRGQG